MPAGGYLLATDIFLLKNLMPGADDLYMNPQDESLPLFYLANALIVLSVAALAGWLGPRVALSRWRLTRRVERKQVESSPIEQLPDAPPSLHYEDALFATPSGEIHSRPWTLPESSDPLTLKAQPDSEQIETRRAYLKLLQCYSQKPVPCANPAGHEDTTSAPKDTRPD
jgi:hypothetical protein